MLSRVSGLGIRGLGIKGLGFSVLGFCLGFRVWMFRCYCAGRGRKL